MEKLFVTKLEIKKVRHLKDITINLSDTISRHLIFTGKNGSGKTSVLDAIATYLKMKFQISDLNLEVASYLSGPVFAVFVRTGVSSGTRMEMGTFTSTPSL